MRPTLRRTGFTLIEMLVVITIVVVLASIVTIISLRMQSKDVVPKAATLIQGALGQAKGRALNEGKPHGVRFLVEFQPAPYPAAPEAPPLNVIPVVRRIQPIQDPGDFRDGWIYGWPEDNDGSTPFGTPLPEPILLPVFAPPNYRTPDFNYNAPSGIFNGWVLRNPPPASPITTSMVFGPFNNDSSPWADNETPPNSNHQAQRPNFTFVGAVEAGDLLEINGNGRLYEIATVLGATATLPSRLVLRDTLAEIVRPPFAINANSLENTGLSSNYRVIRRPRPIPGERPIDLTDRTVVDLSPRHPTIPAQNRDPNGMWVRGASNVPALSVVGGQVFFDVLFSPSGQVLNTPNEILYLWVRENPTAPSATLNWYDTANGGVASPDNQALVAVYSRTGAVMTYPVDHSDLSPTATPYRLAEIGRGSGGP